MSLRRRYLLSGSNKSSVNDGKNYFSITALEDGLTAKLSDNTCEYCIDNGRWNKLSANRNTESINKGQTLYFKGTSSIGTFTISKKCYVQGNIMSLLYGGEFEDKTDLTGYDYAFYRLFYGCTTLTDASNLILPATTLSSYCYSQMFSGCSSLTTAPALPATTLSSYCYSQMFYGCTSLTTAPSLPATTLSSSCYYYMFYGCNSLTTAPALPATTLSSYCYEHMFNNCTCLTTAPELPATTLASGCYYYMFNGCNNLTTSPALKATTLASYCYYSMFKGCSKLNYITMLATDIRATNCLYNWVYGVASSGTFAKHKDMTSLPTGTSGIPTGWIVENYNPFAKEYFTIEPLEDGLTVSFNNSGLEYSVNNGVWNTLSSGVNTSAVNTGDKISFRGSNLTPTSSNGIGKFTISKKCSVQGNIMSLLYGDEFEDKTDLTGYDYAFYRLFYNNSAVLYAHELYLPAVVLSNSCYRQMFYYSYELLTTPELNASNLASNCYEYMFSNCRKIESVPELPAKSLVDCCYKCMFNNCHSLVDVSTLSLPATTLAKECYRGMFEDCKNLMIPPYILPSYNLDNMCYRGMFYNCVNLIKSPVLPSTKLANECYNIMFYNCSKLNHITMFATDISATSCLTNWVYGVAASGTFVKHKDMTSLPSGNNGIPTGWTIEDYNPSIKEYFTIESLEDGLTVSFSKSGLEYSINNGVWNTLSSGVNTSAVNTGDKISFRGNLTPISSSGIGTFIISKKCNLKGNIMSLLYGGKFEDKTDLTGYYYAFYRLFYGCTTLTDASNLILPATTLANYCYSQMFYGCSSLTTSPEELPATTLASYCYNYMFSGCSSLTTAPELPAATLASYCYDNMFKGCTSLTSAPELPATTLANYCYHSMFKGTGLTVAPALPATKLLDSCYSGMFEGCTSLTTSPELPATTLANYCYASMFNGCTSLTTAPELPATTLASGCYYYMFNGCNSLNNITMLATDISANSCLSYWVSGVASSGTFAKHKDMTSLPSGQNGIPYGWSVVDYNPNPFAKEYFTIESLEDGLTVSFSKNGLEYSVNNGVWNTLSSGVNTSAVNTGDKISFRGSNLTPTSSNGIGKFTISKKCSVQGNIMSLLYGDEFEYKTDLTGYDYAFYELFYRCATLMDASNLILPATTLTSYCYYSMFQDCYSLTTAPELPATTLADWCYNNMFSGCSSLTTAPELPAKELASYCYGSMFDGCNSLNHITMLATDISATNCLSYWVSGVASSGTFAKHKDMTSLPSGQNGIPTGWTVEDMIYGCEISLNNQWQLSTSVSNPDTSLYDGVYESFSNKGINNTASIMYIDLDGLNDFTLYIRSYAESSWDYVMVSQLDQTINNSTSYSDTTLIKAHTCGKQNSSTTISGYTKVDFTNIDGGKHRITVVYRKDSSSHVGDDRGYVLIPKSYNSTIK